MANPQSKGNGRTLHGVPGDGCLGQLVGNPDFAVVSSVAAVVD